jgi:hypothetical protein
LIVEESIFSIEKSPKSILEVNAPKLGIRPMYRCLSRGLSGDIVPEMNIFPSKILGLFSFSSSFGGDYKKPHSSTFKKWGLKIFRIIPFLQARDWRENATANSLTAVKVK